MMYKNIIYATMVSVLVMSPIVHGYAHAQPDAPVIVGGINNNVSGEDIDTSRDITLTVKKKSQNPFDENQSNAPQVEGVEFTLSRVEGVDVFDDEVRQKVMSEYSYTYIKEHNMDISRVTSVKTNDKGVATFAGLRPGLYVLSQGNDTVPEVIMLPLASVDGTTFEYDDVIVTKNIPKVTTSQTPPPTEETPIKDRTTRQHHTPQTIEESETPDTTNQEHPQENQGEKNTIVLTPQENTGENPGAPNENPSSTPPVALGVDNGGGSPLFPGGPIVNTGGAVAVAAGATGATILGVLLYLLFSGGTGFAGLRLISKNMRKEEE